MDVSDAIHSLVVDDEPGVRLFLEEVLRREGHEVMTAESGEAALELLRDNVFDLAIVDLLLGTRVDGMRVLEGIRWRWPNMAVVICTGHGSLESAISAIREGIDGYLLKPVELHEVIETVRDALARRQALNVPDSSSANALSFGAIAVDLERHVVSVNGQEIELTPAEFSMFAYLTENAPRVVPPRELVRAAQGYEVEHQHEARDSVKWYIHRLRAKIEPEPSHPRYILTVRGVGYRLAAPDHT